MNTDKKEKIPKKMEVRGPNENKRREVDRRHNTIGI